MKNLLQKLIIHSKNRWQFIGAGIGSFLGLVLVLSAVQLYCDIQAVLNGKDSESTEFVIINKRVNLLNTLGVNSSFSKDEIAEIEAQDFIEQTAAFIPNLFRVSASSSVLGFYTELFFEAIDDAFIDVQNSSFAWQEGDQELPVILSKDYLALYNFGFAPSQGLPQFTASSISRVSLDVTIKGQGKTKVFTGRVVGFSDRINSILVPKDFMLWANQNYGNQKEKGVARLILKTNRSASEQLEQFLSNNGYELSSGRLISSKANTVLQIILAIILLIGLIVFMLSALVFLLNFQLFIAHSKENIRLLLQLGHHSNSIVKLIFKRLLIQFSIICILSFLTFLALHLSFVKFAKTQGIDINNIVHPYVIIITIVIIVLFLTTNYKSIKKLVYQLT